MKHFPRLLLFLWITRGYQNRNIGAAFFIGEGSRVDSRVAYRPLFLVKHRIDVAVRAALLITRAPRCEHAHSESALVRGPCTARDQRGVGGWG